MAQFYKNEFGKDFDCPKCGQEIEVEIDDIGEDDTAYGRCPNCDAIIKIEQTIIRKFKVVSAD